MTASDESDRPFRDKEIARILRRAAELQGGQSSEADLGLTATELERIATESGIDPRHIATAIAELQNENSLTGTSLLGGPFSLNLERVVSGTVDTEKWEAILRRVRGTFRESGTVSQRGDVLEWLGSGGAGGGQNTHVTVTPEGANTRISLFWNEPSLAVPFFAIAVTLGVMLLPIIFATLSMGGLPGVATYLALTSTLFLLARWSTARMTDRKKKEINQLMVELENEISAEVGEPESLSAEEVIDASKPTVATETRIELSSDSEPESSQSEGRDRRRDRNA